MNLIDEKLKNLKKEKRLGLMTHVVVGYPSLETTKNLVKVMEKVGADFIELQIPFSDPLADGSTIMGACEKALQNGTSVKDAFRLAGELSGQIKIPLLFMAYFNTVFKYGTEKFCKDAKNSGISGLIVPDIPIEEEECEYFIKYCRKYDLHHIRVVSPASTDERLEINAKVANGFVYATTRQGITGARNTLEPKFAEYLKKVRSKFKIPLAVGFGISKKAHIEALKSYADIAIVGSVLIDIISSSRQNYLKSVEYFLKEII